VIFIPGFACSGRVWDSTVAQLKGSAEAHMVTFARFAGLGTRTRSTVMRKPQERTYVHPALDTYWTLLGSNWVETAPDAPSRRGTVDDVSNATRGTGPGQRLFRGDTSIELEVLASGAPVQGFFECHP